MRLQCNGRRLCEYVGACNGVVVYRSEVGLQFDTIGPINPNVIREDFTSSGRFEGLK